MLIHDFQDKGVTLRVNGNMLEFESEEPISEQLLDALKNNKQNLIAEILVTALVEVVDGDVFPLHRFKGEHLPKPIMTDLPWLHEQLSKSHDRIEIAAEYSRRYEQAFDTEPLEHRKDGKARVATNNWLLNISS